MINDDFVQMLLTNEGLSPDAAEVISALLIYPKSEMPLFYFSGYEEVLESVKNDGWIDVSSDFVTTTEKTDKLINRLDRTLNMVQKSNEIH